MAATEVERQPSRIYPQPLADILSSRGLHDEREYERLGHAHDREQIVAHLVKAATGPGDANTEQPSRHAGQGWVDFTTTAGELTVTLVSLLDRPLNIPSSRRSASENIPTRPPHPP